MGVLERRDSGTRDVPQSPQNLNQGGLAKPHLGHGAVTGVPHSPQNFRPSGLSKPQLGQRMRAPSGTAVRAAGHGRAGAPTHTPDKHVMDGVSVLHARPRVKLKSRNAFGSGSERRGGDSSGVVVAAEVMGGYGPLLEPLAVVSRAAKVARRLRSRTPARLYL
jgi:hypothetical protein